MCERGVHAFVIAGSTHEGIEDKTKLYQAGGSIGWGGTSESFVGQSVVRVGHLVAMYQLAPMPHCGRMLPSLFGSRPRTPTMSPLTRRIFTILTHNAMNVASPVQSVMYGY